MHCASLEIRVRELELRCQRLRLGMVALGAALGGACLTAALGPPDHVVRSQRFELVNSEGETRGVLELEGTTPRLVLTSPENESIAALCAGPSIVEHQPGRAWFTTDGASGFETDESAEPRRHGLAVLTLGAPSCLTEVVADKGRSSLVLDADGPTAALMAARNEGFCGSALEMLADTPDGKGDFGHGSLVVEPTGARVQLGANDMPGVELFYLDGKPMLELKDASETSVFRAP